MVRENQDVHSEPDKHGRGTRETHPAFGTAIVARSHGTSHPLFQSDVQHSESITLSIRRAERVRDLNTDWVFPTDELVEIEMSLSQWGALVSSIGIGSGVPVTIRSTESDRMVADLPYQPRIAENVDETKAAVAKLLADAKRAHRI